MRVLKELPDLRRLIFLMRFRGALFLMDLHIFQINFGIKMLFQECYVGWPVENVSWSSWRGWWWKRHKWIHFRTYQNFQVHVINFGRWQVKIIYAPCILRKGRCDKCQRIFGLIFETVNVVQTNLSKIKRIDPRSSPPFFLGPLRYVGDGDRYLMETEQEC